MSRSLRGALTVALMLPGWTGGAIAAGSEFNLSCNPDEVLVGISGRQGWWMVGIAARCRTVAADGALGGAVRTTAWRGGTAGTPRTFDCSPAEVMVGYRGAEGDNGYVLHVDEIVCAGWQPRSRSAGTATRAVAAFERKAGAGRPVADLCRRGEVGTRLRGRAGQYLDRLNDIGCSAPAGAAARVQPSEERDR